MSNFYDQVYYNDKHPTKQTKKYAKFKKAKDRETSFLRNIVDLNKDDRLLDVGCGIGNFLEAVQDTGADLWGIDISEIAINSCKQRFEKQDQLICGEAVPLPFADEHFDIVTAWGVIEHFEPISSILNEVKRVLKPTGRAYFMVPNLFYYKFIWDGMRKGKGPKKHQEVETLLAFQDWRNLILSCGYKIHDIKTQNKFNKSKLIEAWKNLIIPYYMSNHFIFICSKEDS